VKRIDVYFSFRSPYSYLATPDILKIQDDYNVEVALRVVLPLAVRDPKAIFSAENAPRARYIGLDAPRRAAFLGMPFKWPKPDPIVQDMATLSIADEQPHIYRLCRLGVEAERRGRGPAFAAEVSALIFSGEKDWSDHANMVAAVARAGLDLDAMDAAICDGDHDQEIEANQEALTRAGQWGVPTFVLDGEPFFGQDRVDTLRWRLDQLAL